MSIIMQVRSVNAPGELHFPFLLSAFVFLSLSHLLSLLLLLLLLVFFRYCRRPLIACAPCAYVYPHMVDKEPWSELRIRIRHRMRHTTSIAVITFAAIIMAGSQSRCNGFFMADSVLTDLQVLRTKNQLYLPGLRWDINVTYISKVKVIVKKLYKRNLLQADLGRAT